MTPPLKIKDWLKERSEKQFVFITPSTRGNKRAFRLKDKAVFREGENVGCSGKLYKIVEFSPNLFNVHITLSAVRNSNIITVEIDALFQLEEIYNTGNPQLT